MIVPKPKQFLKKGEIAVKRAICADEKLSFSIKAFKRIFEKIYASNLNNGEDGIEIKYDPTLSEEEYVIDGATVYASSIIGAKNGLATLFQLIKDVNNSRIIMTDTLIKDKPDVEFRAFFADLARQWHDFDILLGYVDICYLNKIRYLQLHFTDNQSFTLPYKCFPNAATKGRSYTHEEISFLVEYANEASVEIIPEFEGIGHSSELIRNCPDEFGNEYDEKMSDNVMCIGKADTLSNVALMLREMADLFRYSHYIHVGCDEANHKNWLHCRRCCDYMKENNIETTLELYAHFTQKIIDCCLSLGRTPIVWEGFTKEFNHLISKDAVVMSWENTYQTAPELLSDGFKIINAAWKPLYHVPEADRNWTILGEDFYLYHWDTVAKRSVAYGGLTIEPNTNVLGAMLCQWECNYNEEHDWVIKNLPPFSDRCWNVDTHYVKHSFPDIDNILSIENKLY